MELAARRRRLNLGRLKAAGEKASTARQGGRGVERIGWRSIEN
jgi:hypothetical protein